VEQLVILYIDSSVFAGCPYNSVSTMMLHCDVGRSSVPVWFDNLQQDN